MRAERRRSRVAGFTLVEILVVVLIIGVVTAGMLLSMSFAGKDTELETESKRLLSLMDYAREQAELQTRDYGVFFGQHGYEFVVYDVRTGAWRLASEDDALRERTLPSGLEFKLVVDARPIVLNDDMTVPSDSSADSKSSATAHAGPGAQKSPASAPGPDSASDSDSSDSNSPDSNSDAGKSFAPQVMIFSSGELSSFSITVERANAGRSITLDENRDGDVVAKPMAEGGT
ncbi:MAG TPA: type II secretion system minor pseudopilin GspH [Steroidobacteraceae bacterium]|nr:type II secretion system minor pseudopilin GspH [Steroidobacteraceae bacterium]